jgi:hypothetical protein
MTMSDEELRALDVEIHEKVMGLCAEFGRHSEYDLAREDARDLWARENWWAVSREPTPPGCNRRCFPVPHYSTDIAAAWKVVLKLCAGGCVTVKEVGPYRGDDDGHATCAITVYVEEEEPQMFMARADTAPLAICKAALKAIEASKE